MRRAARVAEAITLATILGVYLSGCSAVSAPVATVAVPAQTVTPPPEILLTSTETLAPSETPTPTPEPFEPISVQAPDCAYGGAFKAIEALERYTVRFTFCEPEPAFLAKIAFPTFGIQPRQWLEETGGGGQGSSLLEQPVGTGPYALAEWKRGEELVLQAFPNYWGEQKARTPRLVFRWSIEAAQRLLELQTGTVHGIDNVGWADFATVEADPNLALLYRPPLNVFYIGMNALHPPFDDQRVRQAVAMGIDRQPIVEQFFPPGYEVAGYFTPCSIPFGCTGEPWYEFDPVRAQELLAEAGYPEGFKTELAYRDIVRGYLPQPNLVVKEIQGQLRENLGIDAKIVKVSDPETYLQAVDAGELAGLHLLGWGADYADVTDFLDVHFGQMGSLQFGAPVAEIVEALQNGATQLDSAKREQFYAAANEAIKRYAAAIPISHGGWAFPESLAVGFAKSVAGAHASPFGLEDFSVMSVAGQETLTWLQTWEPLSLYCADETDIDSLRACAQITETLYRFETGRASVAPGLAEGCLPNDDLSVWTCTLRKGVLFHDGSELDANDVVMSLVVQWDAANPLHKGNTGTFQYFKDYWKGFLNVAAP